MKKLLLSLLAIISFAFYSSAEEGMWMLPFIDQNMKDMKSKGLELLPRDINAYQADGKGISNSVVQFGNMGTGAVISAQGLLLTNSHCAYNYIHNMSTMENNLYSNGFWSKANGEEIPVPGLTVTFVRYVGDVTADIMKGVDGPLDNGESEYLIENNKKALLVHYKNYFKDNDAYVFTITNYFDGAYYFLTATEVYQDVRLVGIPPESIGMFGGNITNWTWPRYTGDFALFRIYTAPDGQPASYSNTNVPYKTKSFLNISGNSYQAGDFAMIMGFPASTQRYLPTSEIDFFIQTKAQPAVDVRKNLLPITEKAMSENKEVQFKYGYQYFNRSNTYMKYKGMVEGVDKYGVTVSSKERDDKFQEWVDKSESRKKQHGNTLQTISKYNTLHLEASKAREYIYETFINGFDLLALTQRTNNLRISNLLTVKSQPRLTGLVKTIYKDFDITLDRALAYEAINQLLEKVPAELLPADFKYDLDVNYKGDVKAYVNYLYDHSNFNSPDTFMYQWEHRSTDKWGEDPAIKLLASVIKAYQALDVATINARDNGVMFNNYKAASAFYRSGLKELGLITYPDASRNIRMTYGSVKGYSLPGGGDAAWFTTIDQMMAAQRASGVELPAKLTELYAAKAYSDYTVNDTMKVNFITDTDITGGNSGSPVLNSKGDIIGLVFDQNQEALVGDLLYDGLANRTINVDIHYIRYIIDKYAGAQNILNEMVVSDYNATVPVEQ